MDNSREKDKLKLENSKLLKLDPKAKEKDLVIKLSDKDKNPDNRIHSVIKTISPPRLDNLSNMIDFGCQPKIETDSLLFRSTSTVEFTETEPGSIHAALVKKSAKSV